MRFNSTVTGVGSATGAANIFGHQTVVCASGYGPLTPLTTANLAVSHVAPPMSQLSNAADRLPLVYWGGFTQVPLLNTDFTVGSAVAGIAQCDVAQ